MILHIPHASTYICHSFPSKPLPYELDRDPDRPDICIGTDPYHTPEPLARAVEGLCRAEGVSCARNRPFTGAIVPLAYYGRDTRVGSIMIEVNRRLYMDEVAGKRLAGYNACRALVGRVVEAVRAA